MSVVIVVQARLSSSRLPGKVLLPAGGKPLLAHMLERVRAARRAQRVVVATTTARDDDAIAELCEEVEVECYRGHPLDCLERHLRVGLQHGASAVVKIPSDCPVIDPAVIDLVLDAYHETRGQYAYVSNLHPASWPDGNDVEVVTIDALTTAARETTDAFDREHTTPYIWMRPERFAALNLSWDTGLDYSQSHRTVVDWFEDYTVVREIIETLTDRHGPLYSVNDILRLLTERPELARRNAQHRGYSYYADRTLDMPSTPSGLNNKENTT